MTGTISVSGLGSGLDYSTWITKLVAVKQNEIDKVSTTVSTIQTQESVLSSLKGDYTNLLDSIQTFTDSVSNNNVLKQKAATSTDKAVSATVDTTANNQTLSVEVSHLATETVAESAYTVASYVDTGTKISEISEGAVDAGTLSLYINGKQNKITINSDDTLGNVASYINTHYGTDVTAKVNNDGTFSITAKNSSTNLSLGSSSDTSNFASVMALESSTTTTGITSYTSSNSLYDTDTSTAITSTQFSTSTGGTTAVTAGTFSINGTSFTIGSSSTLDDVVNNINKSSSAGVTAYWDSTAGKLSLTANDTGAVSIDVEAGTSNFTDVMGLTTSTWNTDGSLKTTALTDGSQDLGDNAKVKINGSTITSLSNTITSDVSGLSGVTLTLNSTTTAKATVKVSNDTSALETAVTKLVTSLNSVIYDTDYVTASGHSLYGETVLNSIRNTIRTLATSSVGGLSLANLGITTGKIGTDVKADTNQLVVDTTKLESYLSSGDLDKLKTLLTGDDTHTGILSKMETLVSNATDSTKGYFKTTNDSFKSQVTRLNDKISNMTDAMNAYQTQLEAKFQAMDKLISALEASASIFDSYFNNNTSSSSSSK